MTGGADEERADGGVRRAERAERLARLRGAAAPPAAGDAAALADFLEALRTTIADAPAAAAAVLPFQRAAERRARAPKFAPESQAGSQAGSPPGPTDLDRLPGAGPGLVWALQRAGIARLADLAGCAPEPLADRLGPIGELIDLAGWIAFAAAATVPDPEPATPA